MFNRRRLLSGLAAGCLSVAVILTAPQSAYAQEPADAGEFLISLKDRATEQLGDSSIDEAEQAKRFRVLFNENFDVQTIGKFVLARYWRSASKEERQEFLAVFEEIMVQRFLPLFSDYSDVGFEVGNVRADKRNEKFLIVTSSVVQPNGEPVKVDWRVKNNNGHFMILDIVAEGVSMAITLRSEYATVIKSAGGSVKNLTVLLREKLNSSEGSKG